MATWFEYLYSSGIKYTADRWVMWNGGGTTFANGTWQADWTTGGNDNLIQVIEMPTRGINRALALSFLINVPLGKTMSVHVAGCTGIQTSDAGTVYVYTGKGTWENVAIAIPGSSNAKNLLMVHFATAATAGTVIGLTNVKLEFGNKATPFTSRSYGEELSLCRRYFEKSYNHDRAIGHNFGVVSPVEGAEHLNVQGAPANILTVGVRFKVEKRINPTVHTYDMVGAVDRITTVNGHGIIPGSGGLGTNGIYIHNPATAVATWIAFHWTADAEIY